MDRAGSMLAGIVLVFSTVTGSPGAAQAQSANRPELPKVYGPPGVADPTSSAPAVPPPPAPSGPPSDAAPRADAGGRCTAYFGGFGNAQTMVCPLDHQQAIGSECLCAFPQVPPPGILPSPPAIGHVTQ